MLKCKVMTIMAGACLAGAVVAGENRGFEERDFTSYSVGNNSDAEVLSSYLGFTAPEGNYFAHLSNTGIEDASAYGGTIMSYVRRHVTLAAGQSLSFQWAFMTKDTAAMEQYNDFALFLHGGNGTRLSDIMAVGPEGRTGWQTYTWTPDHAFSGDITWLVANKGDELSSSHLFVDNLHLGPTTPVPEPVTYGMLLAGLGLLGVCVRRNTHR